MEILLRQVLLYLVFYQTQKIDVLYVGVTSVSSFDLIFVNNVLVADICYQPLNISLLELLEIPVCRKGGFNS